MNGLFREIDWVKFLGGDDAQAPTHCFRKLIAFSEAWVRILHMGAGFTLTIVSVLTNRCD
jgi:hypothetical protein